MFAQPMFADIPVFSFSPPVSGGGGGGPSGRHHQQPLDRNFERSLELTLLAFLNTQP